MPQPLIQQQGISIIFASKINKEHLSRFQSAYPLEENEDRKYQMILTALKFCSADERIEVWDIIKDDLPNWSDKTQATTAYCDAMNYCPPESIKTIWANTQEHIKDWENEELKLEIYWSAINWYKDHQKTTIWNDVKGDIENWKNVELQVRMLGIFIKQHKLDVKGLNHCIALLPAGNGQDLIVIAPAGTLEKDSSCVFIFNEKTDPKTAEKIQEMARHNSSKISSLELTNGF